MTALAIAALWLLSGQAPSQPSPEVTAHNQAGAADLAQKQFAQAEQEFRATLRAAPGDNEANYNLGALLLARGAATEAIEHLERVHPATTAARFQLIRAYLQANRTREALHLAAELSAQNKSDVKVHFSLGVLLASEKQYKPAALELEQAESLQPDSFEIAYNLGRSFLRDGNYAKAQLALDRAIKLKPDSPEALFSEAQALAAQAHPMDALALLVKVRKMVPENTDIMLLMARISMSQHYYEDAIPLLESAVAIAPQRVDLHAALGESYLMSERYDKGVTEMEKVLTSEPYPQAYVLLGHGYERLGRYDEAKRVLEACRKLDPKNAGCLYQLGVIAEKRGDTAEAQAKFEETLRIQPEDAGALLELASLRVSAADYPRAAILLKKYVQVSRNPATGYYKLAMVDRHLHDAAAADRDLKLFQTFSRKAPGGSFPNEHLFDYLDNRSQLAPVARTRMDIADITQQLKEHPGQPQGLYLLAEAYLKAGNVQEAKDTITQLDAVSTGDYRALTGTGVLLARYHLYEDATRHFQTALQLNPDSDDVKFDLANALFRRGLYAQALEAAQQIAESGRKDNSYLELLGDIYAHLGDADQATGTYKVAIARNPDNDQDYLSLALLQLRRQDVAGARQTLLEGQKRIPGSGKILWGLGVASALEGNSRDAGSQLERAVDLLPEWSGSYSALGVFYYQTGQIAKAKEVLSRFKNTNEQSGFDLSRIEQVLEQAPQTSPATIEPLTATARQQFLQLTLTLADRTL